MLDNPARIGCRPDFQPDLKRLCLWYYLWYHQRTDRLPPAS